MLGPASAADLGLLEQQIARLKAAFPCHSVGITPADKDPLGHGVTFFICAAKGDVARYMMETGPKSKKINLVQVKWTDWQIDRPLAARHADKDQAEAMVKVAAQFYAASKQPELLAAFRSVQGCGSEQTERQLAPGISERETPHTVIESSGLTFEFRCFRSENYITHDLDVGRKD
jgi:hypothetical protein